MSKLYSSLSWIVFAGLLTAGIFLTTAPETYASFSLCLQEETGHMNKDMPADTGRMQHGMKGMMGERRDSMQGGMKGMMGEMRDSMMNMQMTGDPDQDFAAMMIQHHKGAIRMSEEEINKGKDQKVISMAEKTIKDQKNEIQDLQKFVKTDQTKSGMSMKSDTSMQRKKGMQEETGSARQHTMMDRMHKMQMTGDQDKDYVSMMVMNRQHAIDMANTYLDKGKDENLIKIAKDIIKTNEEDIKDLEEWEMDQAK